MLTRRDVQDRLEKIQASNYDIAEKHRRLRELETTVASELHELEGGVLALSHELNAKARTKMLVRLDRLRACLTEIRGSIEELHRPADLRLGAKSPAR